MPPEACCFLIAGAKVALISYHPNILLKKIQNSYHFSVFGAYTYIYIYKGQQKREITKGSGGFLTARQQSNPQKSVAQYNGATTERRRNRATHKRVCRNTTARQKSDLRKSDPQKSDPQKSVPRTYPTGKICGTRCNMPSQRWLKLISGEA